MQILAIDTSTSDIVTGLRYNSGPAGVVTIDSVITDTRAHQELLIPTIQELLAGAGCDFADLTGIVVGCGPAPFTGLRVGMSTAAALGQALGIPVWGVCSLDAIAHGSTGEILVATDARRREVYWATYSHGQRADGPQVCAPGDLPVGTGYDALIFPESIASRLPAPLQAVPRREATPRAAGLIAVAGVDTGELPPTAPLVPLYLRRPDAVPPPEKPVSPALVHRNAPGAVGETR